jgi:hypothetical protein
MVELNGVMKRGKSERVKSVKDESCRSGSQLPLQAEADRGSGQQRVRYRFVDEGKMGAALRL